MAMDLINIGASGTRAAQAALGVTAQNIANANNADYNRRSLDITEVNATGGIGRSGDSRLSGVRIEGIARSASQILTADFHRTGSDVARADTQLAGLKSAERAVEQAGIYPALVEFEANLAQLSADPLSMPYRETVLESARSISTSFGLAAQGIDNSASETAFTAQAGVDRLNLLAGELARTNTNIARTREGSVSNAALLDQRDALLRDLSTLAGTTTQFDSAGRATVRLGDASGPVLVIGDTVEPLSMTVNPDRTIRFALGGSAVSPASGKLAGYGQALDRMALLRSDLDGVAAALIAAANAAQANGATPSGVSGQPFFSGTGASDIQLALTNGSGIATAPAGSPAGSRNIGNLAALQFALGNGGPTSALDSVLFGLSSEISARGITRDALRTIADSAAAVLASETAVDLDEEAANLLRFQQAFQASGRVIQAATDIFDTILAIR